MKLKFTLFLFSLFFTTITFSQVERPSVNKTPEEKGTARTSEPRKQQEVKTSSVFQLNENDAYQGRKGEFLAQIIIKELPKDFPKYEKWMGVRHYNEIIDDYYKKHLDILIPSLRQKLSN